MCAKSPPPIPKGISVADKIWFLVKKCFKIHPLFGGFQEEFKSKKLVNDIDHLHKPAERSTGKGGKLIAEVVDVMWIYPPSDRVLLRPCGGRYEEWNRGNRQGEANS